VKAHSTLGERILAPFFASSPIVLRVARSHHERMDGSGFPDSLQGDRIPLEARIVAVVDAFDAMTTNRAYRSPRTVAEAIQELRRCSGVHFDPNVVQAFISAHGNGSALPLTA
jgi:HD-GYP domain-containing protein (c-di-GMP phosphodiesterase class II)